MVGELWRPAGGAYNVDNVLAVMVSGLEDELKSRLKGNVVYSSNNLSPSAPKDAAVYKSPSLPNGSSPTALNGHAYRHSSSKKPLSPLNLRQKWSLRGLRRK